MSGTPAAGRPVVAHVDHTTENGGAELALARMLRSGCRSWAPVLVVPAGLPKGVFTAVEDAGVAVRPLGPPQPSGATKASLLRALPFVWRTMQQALSLRRSGALAHADVVHANSTLAAVYAALAVLGSRVPLVVHLRDRIERDALGRLGFLAFRLTALRRATGFIANSEATAATVRPRLSPRQFVEVIPSPIGMDGSERAAPQRSTAPADPTTPVRLGMVARLDSWKGHEDVIRAYALAGIDSRAHLTFVGGSARAGENMELRLAALAQELGLRHVTFAGHRDDVREQIDTFDVCVQFSRRPEPMGQNVLQYLARGKPVIAVAAGGPLEWIVDGENGVLVPLNDIEKLAEAMTRLVDDPSLRARLGTAARAVRVLDDCTIVRRHAAVFDRVVTARAS